MKTLAIYDKAGTIIKQIQGDYIIPVGLPFIEVEVPKGKYIISVDIETNQPVYENIPLTETEILDDKISILLENQKAILRGDMQTLAYNLYPEDFENIKK